MQLTSLLTADNRAIDDAKTTHALSVLRAAEAGPLRQYPLKSVLGEPSARIHSFSADV
ncbi:hypothetical protein ACFVYA_31915 [Amycolatopsis sp. NPDC058278]|uniref:hypothetical protein n=1 Tax=Amycolatopsis sp. NPDC058278 TaxID=3346417 RepID=UPI0036DE5084